MSRLDVLEPGCKLEERDVKIVTRNGVTLAISVTECI